MYENINFNNRNINPKTYVENGLKWNILIGVQYTLHLKRRVMLHPLEWFCFGLLNFWPSRFIWLEFCCFLFVIRGLRMFPKILGLKFGLRGVCFIWEFKGGEAGFGLTFWLTLFFIFAGILFLLVGCAFWRDGDVANNVI